MSGYGEFARFYDSLMGDGSDNSQLIAEAIARWRPSATSLLELGCGTGSVLVGLTHLDSLVGIDASAQMLAIAAEKVPSAHLIRGDIAEFHLGERFDVVACVFDTLNHLTSFAKWISMIECVAEHLEPGGLFIFDVNTIGRLADLVSAPPWVDDFGGSTLIMDVTDAGDSLTTWDIRVFEPSADGHFELTHEVVQELGVELDLVRAAVSASFVMLDEDDGFAERPHDGSHRAHFVCQRRP